MIRIAVLVTLLASQTLAKFKYNEICGVDCRNSWRACMITQISKDEFNPACLESKEFKSFEEDLNPLSACIDFVDDVKGNREVLTAYQEYLQRKNPVTASTTIARSSTADSVVTVISESATSPPAPASSPSSTPRLPPAPTSTEMLPTILPPNEPAFQGDGEASSEIMLAGVGLAAMVLLAICFHLCCRTTKKRSSINEEPLKLNSDDFSGVESEKHVKPDAEENAKWKAYNSSYL